MYTLYYSPATASFVVHWFLIELGVPHELKLVDFATKAQKSPEYLKINPNGTVPTLIVDGVARSECAALIMLLAERHGEGKFSPPPNSAGRAEYFQWMLYMADTVQPAFRAWFYPHEPAGESNIEAAKAQARQKLDFAWDRVDSQLKGRSHIAGNSLSAADFLTTMLMRWSRNMPKPATEWPNIKAYVQRMRALPSFKEVNRRENLTDWLN